MTSHAIAAIAACALSAAAATAQTFVNPTLTTAEAAPGTATYTPFAPVLVPARNTAQVQDLRDRAAIDAAIRARDEEVLDIWRTHYSWIVANQDAFRIALERTLERPGYGAEQMAKRERAYVAVGLAMVADNPLDAEDAIEAVEPGAKRAEIARLQVQYRRRLDAARREIDGWPIIVFATGTVTEGLGEATTDDDDGGKPIGTGSLGATVTTGEGRFTARVSIISADAVAPADFGPLVLTPGSGASLTAGVLDWRGTAPTVAPNHFYATASGVRLRAGSDGTAPVVRATVLGAGALWARDVFNSPLFETSAALTLEGGLGMRWLHGDAAENPFFEDLFDNARSLALGPELGFAFSFGRVTAATQLYFLLNSGTEIAGLTGLQTVAGLSVSGEFIRGKLPARIRGARRERAQQQQPQQQRRQRR